MSELSERLETLPGVIVNVKHVALVTREPNGKPVEWAHDAWRVTVTRGKQSWSTDYQSGIGHRKMDRAVERNGWERFYTDARGGIHFRNAEDVAEQGFSKPVPPSAADVLSCVLSEACSGEDTFEAFCDDMGLDTDSRKALATWEACVAIRDAMIRVLGRELYEALSRLEH